MATNSEHFEVSVPPSELNELLGVKNTTTVPVSSGEPIAAEPAQLTNRPCGKPFQSDIRFELGRVLPSLWLKAQRSQVNSSGKKLPGKEKLRELLEWLLVKRGSTLHRRFALTYPHEGRPLTGHLDVVATPETGPLVAFEVDWAYSLQSLKKLKAAHEEGMHVMWVCGAKLDREGAKALRLKANSAFGATTYGWLFMFHLEHGWL
jgi:hypothetical protein